MSLNFGPSRQGILGAILAGGQSSRFGSDKASALIGNQPLLSRVAANITPQVGSIIVVGGPERTGFKVIPDRPGPDLGPLAGLNAALHNALVRRFAWVLTVPCDAAVLPSYLIHSFVTNIGSSPAIFASTLDHAHPTIGLWSITLCAELDYYLTTDPEDRSLRRWGEKCGASTVMFTDSSIININTPEDLADLRF